jgi:Sec-independent protein translocase protein TatA
VIDLVVFLFVVGVIVALVGRGRRLPRLGRGFRSGVREFRRARMNLPPADPELRDEDTTR